MKINSKKVLKTCALSLGLLMLGGATITPINKVYAEEPVQQNQQEISWRFKITYKEGNPEFNGVWVWKNKEEGHFVPFKTDDSGYRYIDTIIKCKTGDTIGYIICKYGKDSDEKYKILKKDESEKNGGDGISKNDRTVTVEGEGTEFSLSEGTVEPKDKNEIKPTTAQKIEGKQLPVKDVKVWKGDTNIEWKKPFDKAAKNDDLDPDVKDILGKISKVEDLDGRDASDVTQPDGKEGRIKVIFNDGSYVKLNNKLYVSNHIVGAATKNTPADAVTVDLNLGEGVKAQSGDKEKIGDSTNTVNYERYKIKPGTDIKNERISLIPNTPPKTIFEYVPAKPVDNDKVVKWESLKTGESENFTVEQFNNVFVAKAVKKPATPDSSKKTLVPSVKPSSSKSLDYKIVPEKKTEKKVKPSEKVRKSYKNLRISREKNVVAVKAAKLLLEIAPERVKDVKTNLINLIAKSESLVKNADTILEKLEAKYEF